MELDSFLADSVVAAEGKLYVQGAGWNQVNVPTTPFRLARAGIGLVFHVPYTATNQTHKFEMYLRNEDGQEVVLAEAPPEAPPESEDGKVRRLGGEFNVGRPPNIEPGDEQLVSLAINVDGLMLEQPGRYEFVIEIDGTEVKRMGFRVIQVPQMGPVMR